LLAPDSVLFVPASFNNSLAIDRRLFRVEIRASIVHTDALFRAGILTRLEAERFKNGLWTMLKRAEHDRHYFDSLASTDLSSFVEARLAQLTNESAARLHAGRSREQRSVIALRLWLREETVRIDESLALLQDALHDASSAGGKESEFLLSFVKFFAAMPSD
jgi:argininosuccinate lyase